VRRPPSFEGFRFQLTFGRGKTESVFKALADGGKITMPLEKTFWRPNSECLKTVRRRLDVSFSTNLRHHGVFRKWGEMGSYLSIQHLDTDQPSPSDSLAGE